MHMMMDLSAYRDIFIEELNDQLERMDQSLLALEQSPSAELVQTLFRAAHTIKGSASTMDFRELSDLTHEVEFALEWVRSEKPEVTAELIDTLFRSLDAMKVLRDQYVRGGPYTDVRAVVHEIHALIRKPKLDVKLQSAVLKPITANAAQEAVLNGQQLYAVHVLLREDCMMKGPRYHILRKRLEEGGSTVLSCSTEDTGLDNQDTGEQDEHYRQFIMVIASSLSDNRINEVLSSDSDIQTLDVKPYLLHSSETAVTLEPSKAENEVRVSIPEPVSPSIEDKAKTMQPTVRVSVERLDHLMNLVGELLIDQTSLADLSSSGARKDTSTLLQNIGGV
jgi:two-component system chemotaxis sensor kinase CheA